jgi:transcriptional regulator with XRE-family HTH domain
VSSGSEKNIWDRLRSERQRLRLDLADAARVTGVSISGYRRWEVDRVVPGDALAALADAGFDIQFIVTGVRLPDRVQDVVATYGDQETDRAVRALRLVMEVGEELGIIKQLSAEQLQILVGYAHQWAPTRDSLRAFVETAIKMGLGGMKDDSEAGRT